MANRIKPWQIGILGCVTLAIATYPSLALAQRYNPPQRGIPGRREGAGTRSPVDRCITGTKPLTGLIPANNFGTTTSQTPTLLWYVPSTGAKTAELRLIDDHDNELFTTTLPLANIPGIVSLQLPAQVTAKMAAQKDYHWQFSLTCNTTDPSKNPFVEGVLQRVTAESGVQQQLKTAGNSRDRATVFAEAGIWHDAIAVLAKERCAKPTDANVNTSWKTLLTSVGLQDLADIPFTPSCKTMQ